MSFESAPQRPQADSGATDVIYKMESGAPEFPNPEVRSSRRKFTAEYKRTILLQADFAVHGELGPLLRREGLTYTHLSKFREQLRANNLIPEKGGRKPKSDLERENDALRVRITKLEHQLEKQNLILEYQKKLAVLLGTDHGETKP